MRSCEKIPPPPNRLAGETFRSYELKRFCWWKFALSRDLVETIFPSRRDNFSHINSPLDFILTKRTLVSSHKPLGKNKSIHSQMFFKTDALKNLANFTGKHLSWSCFLIKFQAFMPVSLLKRNSNTGVFLTSVSCVKSLRTKFFIEHFRWLLLKETFDICSGVTLWLKNF